MSITVDKYQAAYRQLNTAIRIYFSGGDLVSVHTLAGASHIIFHDLVENKHPNGSWEITAAQDSKLELGKFLKIAREAQNFIKHASRDPNGVLTLNEEDTEHLLFLVIQNICILLNNGEVLSNEATVFQLWFEAVHKYSLNEQELNEIFDGIDGMSKNEQIEYGNKLLSSFQINA